MEQLTFWREGRPAKVSASQGKGGGWTTSAGASCSILSGWLTRLARGGWSGRTSPASFHRTAGEPSPLYYLAFLDGKPDALPADGETAGSSRAGQTHSGSHGELLTLSFAGWTDSLAPSPSGGGVCGLSDILETGGVPPRYYLTARACLGILRRAKERGKALPPELAQALEAQGRSA